MKDLIFSEKVEGAGSPTSEPNQNKVKLDENEPLVRQEISGKAGNGPEISGDANGPSDQRLQLDEAQEDHKVISMINKDEPKDQVLA